MIEINSHLATPRFRGTSCLAAMPRPALRLTICLLFVIGLAACTPAAVRPGAPADEASALSAQVSRESALALQPDWSFSGRVALSQGKDGGSGRIDWIQRGGGFDIRLSAPITGRSWRLSGIAGAVKLEGLDGGTREGPDAETLLREATGWTIPVEAMAHWVRGARADGESGLDFDAQSRPGILQQRGWSVEYRDWDGASPPRPTRVFARQGEASVRLVIDRWSSP